MKLVKRVFSATSAAVIGLSTLMTVGFTGVASAAGLNCTWTGATNNNFNTASNWSNCSGGVPSTGDNLVFDVTSLSTSKNLTNDISNLSVATVTFQGTVSDLNYVTYTLNGNAFTVTSGIVNTSNTTASIGNALTLSGNITINAGQFVSLNGAVNGNATVTKAGTGGVYFAVDGALSGSLTANAGSVYVGSAAALGSAAIILNDGADIQIGGCSDNATIFANDLIFQGASSSPSGDFPTPKLTTGTVCSGGGGGGVSDEAYGKFSTSDATVTLSGTITLSSDVSFGGMAKTTTLSGALAGGNKFTLLSVYSGSLVVNSSSNNSGTANGTYTPDPVNVTLSDSQPTHSVSVGNDAVVVIDGTRGVVNVEANGTLKGTGTVGALTVLGTVAPGHSPGCLTSGDLSLSGTYQAEIGGNDACTGYDQLKVNGTVTLNNATLSTSLYNGFLPKQGAKYTIIDNDGSDAVTGTFANLAEGATFKVSDGVFKISYVGGDGNDVVLTVVTAPTTPDTGFAFVGSNPAVTFGAAIVAAGAILILARKMRPSAVRVRASSRRRK